MASDASLLTAKFEDGRLELAAGGAWTAGNAGALETLVDGGAADAAQARSISIDMGGVRGFDTFGAWLLERLMRQWRGTGGAASIVGMPEHDQTLLKEMRGVNLEPAPAPAKENALVAALAALGKGTTGFGRDLLIFANMLGAIGMAGARVLARPRDFRFTSAVNQLDRVCWQAVPIILLITFLIGAIIAQQGIFHFRKFGAEMYAVDLVDMLILPRVLVLIVALPVLTFLGSMAALYGGGLVAWLYGGMSPEIYISRLEEAITLTHFKVGMIKAPFMGLVIGVVACAEGLLVKGSAESLGLQTTASVVKSIFLVIVLDGLFAIFFASIGM